MAEPRPRRTAAWCALALAAALGSGCASAAPRPSPRQPVTLSEAERDALATLLRLEDSRSAGAAELRALARSSSPTVRRYSALAAGRLRDSTALPALLGLLADPDTAVAATAAFAVGQMGDTTAVPALRPLLTGDRAARHSTVAAEAAYALGKLRSAEAHAVLDSLLRAAPDETALGPAVGSALLAVWRFPRPADLSPVLRWVGSPDPEIRWRAAYALVRRPTPAATGALLRLMEDPDARVRALAVRGLTGPLADSAGIGAAAVLPQVIQAVEDPSYPVRMGALRSLGTHPHPQAMEALRAALGAGEAHAVLSAAESLGRLGPAAATAAPALRNLAQDATAAPYLRQVAVESLARVVPAEGRAVAEQLATADEWRLRAAAARVLAASVGPRAASLQRLLRDPDGRVAHAALEAALAGAADTPEVLRPQILDALGAADVMVRTAALGALARLREPATLPLVLDAYARAQRDTLNDAALAAVDALAALHRHGSAPPHAFFARFARSPDPLIRLRVHQAFGAAAAAWGPPLPLDTGLTPAEYRALVDRWVAPVLAGARRPEAILETERGPIRLRLFPEVAPLTVASFARLAAMGYFDGQRWPRVVPNFVVQGGDPRGDTNGGPGYAIRDEFNRHRYGTGSVGMALAGPDTGGSQFFVTHFPQPHLDGGYTLFGETVDGQEVTERLLPGDALLSIRIVP